ncbi:MAG: substrate-binding domain-containing protein [Acidimicrobiales bacterium]
MRSRAWCYRLSGGLLSSALLVALAGCSSGATPPGATHAPAGTAEVAYAASLEQIMSTVLEPGFEKASGDRIGGPLGAGSNDLAEEILAGEISPGVFLSVGARPIESLWPQKRASFAMALASDPLVVAYSPHSPKAPRLNAIARRSAPLSQLFSLMASPGFKLARTDPNADPQGAYFELMCHLAQSELHLRAGTAERILGTSPSNSIGDTSQVFAEAAVPSLISSAAVDAGSAYLSQALQYHLSYIKLPSSLDFAAPSELSRYESVSIRLADGSIFEGGLITLDAALVHPAGGRHVATADTAADSSFLSFLLSGSGRRDLRRSGYELEAPGLVTAPGYERIASVLPASVLARFRRLGGRVSRS